jgi:hypothetical protein
MSETQNQMVLNYLKTGKVLTPIEALDLFGCFRLSARVYELKDKGWPIHCKRKALPLGKVVGHYSMTQDKLWWPDQH